MHESRFERLATLLIMLFVYVPIFCIGLAACDTNDRFPLFDNSGGASASTSPSCGEGGHGGDAAASSSSSSVTTGAGGGDAGAFDVCDCTEKPPETPCGNDALGNCYFYQGKNSCWYYCADFMTGQIMSYDQCPNPCAALGGYAIDPAP